MKSKEGSLEETHFIFKCLHTQVQDSQEIVDITNLKLCPPLIEEIHVKVL